MSTPRRHDTRSPEGSLLGWRRHLPRRAGFAPHLAEALAGDPRYDLHALIALNLRRPPCRSRRAS